MIKVQKTKIIEGEYFLALVKKKKSSEKFKIVKLADEQDLIENGFVRKEIDNRIGFKYDSNK